MTIGLFYGSTNGNTQEAAEKIAENLGADTYDVGKLKGTEELQKYDCLILGTSTWYDGDLQDDWDSYLKQLKQSDLKGKKVAFFGLGDQEGYGSDFVSAMRILYDAVLSQGGTTIGKWETSGYSYDDSAAVINGKFIGLALDEDNQSELSDERIKQWCSQIKETLGI